MLAMYVLQTTETFLHVKFFLSGDSAVPIAWLCPGTGNTLGQEKILILTIISSCLSHANFETALHSGPIPFLVCNMF